MFSHIHVIVRNCHTNLIDRFFCFKKFWKFDCLQAFGTFRRWYHWSDLFRVFCTNVWCVRLHKSFRMNYFLPLRFSSELLLVFLRVLLWNKCCRFFACFNYVFCCMFSYVSCKNIYAFFWLLCAFLCQNI